MSNLHLHLFYCSAPSMAQVQEIFKREFEQEVLPLLCTGQNNHYCAGLKFRTQPPFFEAVKTAAERSVVRCICGISVCRLLMLLFVQCSFAISLAFAHCCTSSATCDYSLQMPSLYTASYSRPVMRSM